MENSRSDPVELGFDFLFQLGLLVLIFGLSIWLWPDGVGDAPVSMVALGDWIWIFGSAAVALLGLLASYFVLMEPVLRLVKRSRSGT